MALDTTPLDDSYFFKRGLKDAQQDRRSLFRNVQGRLEFDCGEIPPSVEEDWDPAKRIAYMAGYDSYQWV